MIISLHIPVTLILGAALHVGGAILWPELIPLRILAYVLMMSGYLGLLSALGLGKPLNKLSAVLAGYGAVGHLGWLLMPTPDAFGAVYIVCMFAAFLVTSVAGLHRKDIMRSAGIFGAVGTAVPLVVLIVGHVALGGFGFLGMAWGRGAVSVETLILWPAEALLASWVGAAGVFLVVSRGIRGFAR